MADLIAKYGGIPLSAPALREIPLGEGPEVTAFAEQLTAGGFDVVIFETGVGVRYLAQAIEARMPRETWIAALARAQVVARGPKPDAALRELGARVDLRYRRRTHGTRRSRWLMHISRRRTASCGPGIRQAEPRAGRGTASSAGRPSRGCGSTGGHCPRTLVRCERRSRRSRWDGSVQRPLHVVPASRASACGRRASRAARPTSALRSRTYTVVGSIGPTTSETLRMHGLPVDVEPAHPKLGHLIAAFAAGWRAAGKAAVAPDAKAPTDE